MAAITGRGIGPKLMKALGLDGQRVRTIDIHVAAKEMVSVKVERLMIDSEAGEVVSVLDDYALIDRPSIIDNFDTWFASALDRTRLNARA